MDLSNDEKQRREWERSHALHDKYRGTGLALSLTIIGLSGAVLEKLRPQGCEGLFFFLPIALSIVQQACLFMGQQHEARASWAWFIASSYSVDLQTVTDPDRKAQLIKISRESADRGFTHNEGGTLWFSRADCLCWASVLSFLVAGAIAATHMPPASIK